VLPLSCGEVAMRAGRFPSLRLRDLVSLLDNPIRTSKFPTDREQ